MDLLGIALVVFAVWIAIVVVALALARAAGKADAERERQFPVDDGSGAGHVSALDALGEEIERSTPEPSGTERARQQRPEKRGSVARTHARPPLR